MNKLKLLLFIYEGSSKHWQTFENKLIKEVERSLVLNFKLSDSEVSLRAGVGYGWGREGCCQVVKYDKASFRQN